MKKIAILVCALMMVFGCFTACGGDVPSGSDGGSSVSAPDSSSGGSSDSSSGGSSGGSSDSSSGGSSGGSSLDSGWTGIY